MEIITTIWLVLISMQSGSSPEIIQRLPMQDWAACTTELDRVGVINLAKKPDVQSDFVHACIIEHTPTRTS